MSSKNLRSEAREAAAMPQAENAFRVFRLNQWVSQARRWLSMATWDAAGESIVLPELLEGRSCVAGLDLASVSDVTAWVLLFPGSPTDPEVEGFTVLCRFWLPRAAVEARGPMKEQFEAWERAGYLTVTDGEVTDYRTVQADIGKDAERFTIELFGYDPWNATHTVLELEDGGLEGVKVPQSSARLTDPCKRLESLLAERKLWHGGNPILRWMADNVELETTGDGLFKPSKRKSGDKIDGIAALVNALFVSLAEAPAPVQFISFHDDD